MTVGWDAETSGVPRPSRLVITIWVGVGVLDRDAGQEHVSWHGLERVFDPGGAGGALAAELVGELGAESLRLVVAGGVGVHRSQSRT